MRLDTINDDTSELALRIGTVLTERLLAMRDEMIGQPCARDYDRDINSTQWCWVHERNVRACHRDDLGCTGETITAHDPTGEAAVANDPAREHRRLLERHLLAAHNALEQATTILTLYAPARLVIDRAGIGSCTDCHLYFDGQGGKRLSSYKGGDLVCPACRARRDRSAA